jgi:hypothetical protein
MKTKTEGAGKPAPKGDTTSTERSSAKVARWQAAAERDGFLKWSTALTAWANNTHHLTPVDYEKKDEQLRETEEKRKYVRKVLADGGLEAWEAKEYGNLEIKYTEEIATLKAKANLPR